MSVGTCTCCRKKFIQLYWKDTCRECFHETIKRDRIQSLEKWRQCVLCRYRYELPQYFIVLGDDRDDDPIICKECIVKIKENDL
ncbi:hypothetical protein KAR91_28695 [Candidatus Pacearchaeota archaeon]|nr:hypothetical protein [Candidatus Pacearchaeota archaeon]